LCSASAFAQAPAPVESLDALRRLSEAYGPLLEIEWSPTSSRANITYTSLPGQCSLSTDEGTDCLARNLSREQIQNIASALLPAADSIKAAAADGLRANPARGLGIRIDFSTATSFKIFAYHSWAPLVRHPELLTLSGAVEIGGTAGERGPKSLAAGSLALPTAAEEIARRFRAFDFR
jgi:hypothetical protein